LGVLSLAEEMWEQAVEKYLALDRGLFLNPQYLIGEPGVWEANPDFLAISFPENMVWMVEVTKTPGPRLFGKVSSFEQDYSWRIREQLVGHKIIREAEGPSSWTIGLWIFAPSVDLPKLEGKATQAGLLNYKATALEDTIKPAWDKRFR
jgi:hypothetical protein